MTPLPPDNAPLDLLRVLLVVNSDRYFLSHRVPMAAALRSAGALVTVAGGGTGLEEEVAQAGFEFQPIPFDRTGTSPVADLRTVIALYRLCRRIRPAVVHNIAVKASLVGSLAGQAAGVPHVVNSITGLGYLFTSTDRRAAVVRGVIAPLFRRIGRSPRVAWVFFNRDDQAQFMAWRFASASRSFVIPGSGVDTNHFMPGPPRETGSVLMCSRLLRDKGIGELVEAMRRLRGQGIMPRVIVAGDPDPLNPHSIPPAEVAAWVAEGVIECPGFVADTRPLLAGAAIAVLPSWREGIPLFLLEALAAGLPVVTTDVPGCREVIIHGEQGLLVPCRDAGALAGALQQLLLDRDLRAAMGQRARRRAEEHFSNEVVAREIVELYRRIVGRGAGAQPGIR